MIGFNGGLIGKSNSNTGLVSQPGVWTPLEQLKALIDGTWIKGIPSGYRLALSFENVNGGRLAQSTWNITSVGSPKTYVSTGGVGNTGYFSNAGRLVNNDFYRITEDSTLSGKNRTYAIWYKGTQNIPNVTYGPGVPLFGDISGSVFGGLGINSGKATFVNAGTSYNSTSLVNTGNWVHIAFTISSTSTLMIYTNGVPDSTHSITVSNNTRCTDIGAHYAYSGVSAPTQIDGVAVYDRVLTETEIVRLYNAGSFI